MLRFVPLTVRSPLLMANVLSAAADVRGLLEKYLDGVSSTRMDSMREKVVLVSLITICCVGCRPAPSPENGLLGVWQIQVIENITGDGSSINNSPQPSLAIFARSHYSLIWIPGTTGMRAFNQRWFPTDEEKIQRYGEIVMNAGMYTRTASTITVYPVVSRFPEFMGGGRLLYEYQVQGETLILTSLDEYSYDGIKAPWAAAGNRVKLTLMRLGDL